MGMLAFFNESVDVYLYGTAYIEILAETIRMSQLGTQENTQVSSHHGVPARI